MRATVMASNELDAKSDVHRSVIDAIRAPLETINADVELCLRYYKVTFRGKPLDRIVVTGSESSAWLAEFLEERLGTRCEMGNPFVHLSSDNRTSATETRQGRWATAVGLSRR
jgi:type IV pilus assembly protein PilM